MPGLGAQPPDAEPSRSDLVEGLLFDRLLRGELTSEQYQGAIAGLAAREEARNPIRLPFENGPAPD